MTHDYTRKGGVVHTEILLPPHAPPSFSDRSTLWNSVELYEKAGNAQLAREIDAALPIELSREEQIRLVREYCSSQFVSRGKLPLYNPQFEQGKPYKRNFRQSGNSPNYGKFTRTTGGSEDGLRFPENVLTFPTVQRTAHPTQKPVELCEYFIKTYTRPGELVADICAGSGTTAVAALNTGRRFVCFETAPAFYAAASERIRVARSAVEAGEKGV